MPYVAHDTEHERIYLATWTREALHARYRTQHAPARFTCPACGQEMTLVLGEQVTPHFRHLPNQACTFEGHAVSQAHLDAQALLFEFFAHTLALPHVTVEAPLSMSWRPRGRIADLLVGQLHSGAMVIEVQISPISPNDLYERTLDYHRAGVGHVAWLFDSRARSSRFSTSLASRVSSNTKTSAHQSVSYHHLGHLIPLSPTQPTQAGLLPDLFDRWVRHVMQCTKTHPRSRTLAQHIFDDPEQEALFWPLLDQGVLPTPTNLIMWSELRRFKSQVESQALEIQKLRALSEHKEDTIEMYAKKCDTLENKLEHAIHHARQEGKFTLYPPYRAQGQVTISVERVVEERPKGMCVTYLAQEWFPTHHVTYDKTKGTLHMPYWLAEKKGMTDKGKLAKAPR